MSARIAFLITTLSDGGAERQLVELVTRLPRSQFEPAVIVLARPPQPPADRLLQSLRHQGVAIHFLGARHAGHAWSAWTQLCNRLRSWRPALLQCFLAHANVLGAIAGRRLGIRPIVAGIRVAEQRNNWHRWLQRRTAAWVDKYTCVSQAVAEFAARDMRLSREKLLVIPNGIDVSRWQGAAPVDRGELGVEPSRRLLLFVGRLDRQKRPDWLLERMPAVFRKLPQHDLVIAGEGPLRETLARRARELGVAQRVHFIGWRSDVERLLAAAEVLLASSAWEGMPNVVLEAMAAGRSVVATDVHGVRELLGDLAAQQVVPVDDPQAFAAAVVRIARQGQLAARLGLQNRQRVKSQFSIESTVRAYVDLYASLLAASRPS